MFGVDLFALSPFLSGFLLSNDFVGLLLIPVLNLSARWTHARFGKQPKFQKFLAGIAGADIVAARAFLARLERFKEES